MPLIYHVTTRQEWEDAQASGDYRVSTRGRTLEEEGFIHCSQPSQVAPIANLFYKGLPDLVLLTIDEQRVKPEVRYEAVPGWDEPFAHIYGPLNTDAVVSVTAFEPGENGEFRFEDAGR
jgi:uncharacterized protein (DUF952 family)